MWPTPADGSKMENLINLSYDSIFSWGLKCALSYEILTWILKPLKSLLKLFKFLEEKLSASTWDWSYERFDPPEDMVVDGTKGRASSPECLIKQLLLPEETLHTK